MDGASIVVDWAFFVLGLLGFFSLSQSIGEAGHVFAVLLNVFQGKAEGSGPVSGK